MTPEEKKKFERYAEMRKVTDGFYQEWPPHMQFLDFLEKLKIFARDKKEAVIRTDQDLLRVLKKFTNARIATEDHNRKVAEERELAEQKKTHVHLVVGLAWEESEEGWGVRPDGYSIHPTEKDCREYVKEYWAKMPNDPPSDYSRPSGEPFLALVDKSTYYKLFERPAERPTLKGARIYSEWSILLATPDDVLRCARSSTG
jgi:hypothetical protein